MVVIPQELRINHRIRIKEVRLIGPEGEQMGVVQTHDAMQKAQEVSLDLVEVAPSGKPPVCRIMDYSKYKYEQEKKSKEARKHQKIIHLKEIKIKPRIEEHDYQVKLYHLKRFLTRGDRAKLTMVFRGREMSHVEIGRKVIDRAISDLVDVGEVEKGPTRDGRNIMVFFVPRTTSSKKTKG
ncbi:MAG: translation initiation factor IF-3 [Candidatus Omnitrophica bacterium]|nr:translation initiation factor IF-3 [Candidatus Omnitrophota bacterium]MBU4457307.1 translation initiation factor IF-3 [Candidatus Omnitrophota bacterium]